MDKERLRIPSDSSSGSSSRGGTSPNMAGYNKIHPSYLLAGNNLGPPPNSPASFSPLPPSPHSLPPPPGLPHPSLGSIYQFPHCPAPGFQNLNYPIGMPTIPSAQSQVPGRYQPVAGAHNGHFINGFPVPNGMMPTTTSSPPPGYNYFGNAPHQTLPHGCSMHPSQHQNCGPFNTSQHVPYNQSGDSFDLENRLNMLLNSPTSGVYESVGGGVSFGSDFMPSPVPTRKEELHNINASHNGLIHKEERQSVKTGSVMNPIIENLVGSMSMSNGTYTHFGPAISPINTSVTKTQNGQVDYMNDLNHGVRLNGNLENERKTLFSQIAVTAAKDTMKENAVGVANVGVIQQRQVTPQPLPDESMESKDFLTNNTSGNAPINLGVQPRASSPRDSSESSSRPQTPGKPSYLEILTKAGLKNQQATSSHRKTSSTSSSPVQSAFSASDSVPNLSHRKSVDYFIGGSTSSTPSSSCPSASSSPATKPRNSAPGAMLKGKENLSSTANFFMKQATSKNSPSSSPVHNVQTQQQSKGKFNQNQAPNGGIERKVLSSQNSSSGGKNTTWRGLKNGKVNGDKSIDLEETNDEGEWGWKTYTSRGRNNNLSSVGNKNSQKRTSNGHCSSEPSIENLMKEDDDEEEASKDSNDEGALERKAGPSSSAGSSVTGSTASIVNPSHSRKPRDKEKPRNRKDDRHCVSRRLENLAYIWLTHMISALTWLWSLVTDVASLSASLGVSLMQDFYIWTKTKALPNFSGKINQWRKSIRLLCGDCWHNWRTKIRSFFGRSESSQTRQEDTGNNKSGIRHDENILSLLGPERNISLPASGDEALKRLLSVKGQDPYSILGVRSDSSEETIRRYYKRQAVLVHPDKNLIVGAEEAFKILARAFEMVGDPNKRTEYHQKLMEAQAKEKFCGEIGNLLEQLRKKMEAASSTIRCTKCNSRHKKNLTDRPLFAARYCSQCRIHHGAREGELWAERGGWFGITWNYFACMDAHVWEINEWARCQKTNLKHIKADAHCVMYRLVAGGNNQNHHNQHCHGAGATCEEDRFGAGSEADEWDSLINNLCKSSPGSAFGKTTGVPGKTGCCNTGGMNGNTTSTGNQTAGRRKKGKRNK